LIQDQNVLLVLQYTLHMMKYRGQRRTHYTMTMAITGEKNEGTRSAAVSVAAAVKKEPLLVASAKCSYSELLALVETLDFGSLHKECRVVCVLPPELAYQVLQCLVIQRVDPDMVDIVSCSSHDQVHPLEECLSDDETTWWISAQHSMPWCRGSEYIQLLLGPTLRRLVAVSIKIPPLPQGNLSVREFRIESPTTTMTTRITTDGEWTAASQVFTV
jgi:hypothetical protein